MIQGMENLNRTSMHKLLIFQLIYVSYLPAMQTERPVFAKDWTYPQLERFKVLKLLKKSTHENIIKLLPNELLVEITKHDIGYEDGSIGYLLKNNPESIAQPLASDRPPHELEYGIIKNCKCIEGLHEIKKIEQVTRIGAFNPLFDSTSLLNYFLTHKRFFTSLYLIMITFSKDTHRFKSSSEIDLWRKIKEPIKKNLDVDFFVIFLNS